MLYVGKAAGVRFLLEHLLYEGAIMVADGTLEVMETIGEDALD